MPRTRAMTPVATIGSVAATPGTSRTASAVVSLIPVPDGYARVLAVPDSSRCGHPGGACLDNEQVFLAEHGGQWSYLTSGTGIVCEADDDLFPALLTACRALGLRH